MHVPDAGASGAEARHEAPAPTGCPRSAGSSGRAARLAWALFDWANSPFTTLIVTFVFPPYFVAAIIGDEIRGQAAWGYAMAASGLLVAVLSPLLGAIADAGGRRKPWILGCTLLCIAGSALLWFARPGPGSAAWAIFWVIVANLGFEFGGVFTNAMLPDIVEKERLGRLSGWAWGLGYGGGLVALAIALGVFIGPETPPLGLDHGQAEQVRILGPLVAVWFAAFAWPLFVLTPDKPSRGLHARQAIEQGWRRMRAVVAGLRRRTGVARFLLAHMLYADGLATLFAFGGVYVAGTFGMTLSEVVAFGVLLNLMAGLGAFAFGWIDDWLGSRRTVVSALIGLSLAGVAAISVQTKPWLWVAGSAIGLFVGPVQAASRSLMARLSPAEEEAEFFGLFALSGKATAFAGPAVVALATEATRSQRMGLATIVFFWLAGLCLLLTVSDSERSGSGPGARPQVPDEVVAP